MYRAQFGEFVCEYWGLKGLRRGGRLRGRDFLNTLWSARVNQRH